MRLNLMRNMVWGFALLIAAAAVYVQIKFSLLADKGWLLFAADEWVGGKKLYIDIFEINPPLIIWLYAVPAWLAQHISGADDWVLLGLLGLAGVVLCVLLCLRIIAFHPAFAESRAKRRWFGTLLFALFVCLNGPDYFFDREHIMLVFTFPYLLRFAPAIAHRTLPMRLRMAVAFCAAIGFFIKPHAMVFFTVLQLYYMLSERSLHILKSIENRFIYCWAIFYGFLIMHYMPEYWHIVLPMALATYSDFKMSHHPHTYLSLAFIGAAIPLLDFRLTDRTPYRKEVYYFTAITVFYALYALVNNGWSYTYQPLLSMLIFLTAWLGWEYRWLKEQGQEQSAALRRFEFGRRACFFALGANGIYGLMVLVLLSMTKGCGGFMSCNRDPGLERYISEHSIRSFGVMSGEFTRWPEISRETGARWDTRFNHLWMLPGLLLHGQQNADRLQWIFRYMDDAYAEDLDTRKPDAVFVDNSDIFFPTSYHIDILKIMTQKQEFMEAWSRYRYATTFNSCKSNRFYPSSSLDGCRYDVYLRVEP